MIVDTELSETVDGTSPSWQGNYLRQNLQTIGLGLLIEVSVIGKVVGNRT